MNGDSRETGKRTPSGDPDPSVFSTTYNRAGIRLGTAVGLFVRRKERLTKPSLRYRDFWGVTKREELVSSLGLTPFDDQYALADPQAWNRLSFRPGDVGADYLAWPKLTDLASMAPINGLMEKRGGALIDIDPAALVSRMKTYFDPKINWAGFKLVGSALAKDAARFDAKKARKKALATATYVDKQLVRYIVRPFDVRHAYFTGIRPIWNEPRPQLWDQFSGGNSFLMSRPGGVAKPEGAPLLFTRCLGDNDAQRGHAYYFPFEAHDPAHGMLAGETIANLSVRARAYLCHLELPDPDKDATARASIWLHALAIGFAPGYLADNSDGIAIGWPRVPLPDDRLLFNASAALGARLAAIIDTEADVVGTIADHFKLLGAISATNLRVSAGWGRKDRMGRINPGRGRVEMREWTEAEKIHLKSGFATVGLSETRSFELLGRAIDVYLNGTTFWRGVPEAAWEYFVGGYQVLKKWLSYREEAVLGRSLTKDEAREVSGIVRRLTALVLMADELDANYVAARDKAYPWPMP